MRASIRSFPVFLAVAALAGALRAQAPVESQFSAAVRLQAGVASLGGGRLYPSPVFRDMNGDGLSDLVVGDLVGRLTIALRTPGAPPRAFAAEFEMMAADGGRLDFHNW